MSTSRLVSAFILGALVLAGAPQEAGAQGSSLTCASCLVVDETGATLWARDAGIPRPVASATKMVTALVTVESASLDEKVRVSSAAAATPGGKLSLEGGEVLSVRDLLAALLLNSSNDAGVVLAEHVGGGVETFVRRMNLLADRLGADTARFANPHGLDAVGHEASAKDLALIGAAVLEEPVLAELVATREMTIETSARSAELENTNLLLGDYVGAIGIKTGFTAGAGNVLVAAAEREGRTLIAVAMNSDDAFADATALLDIGFAAIARTVLVRRDLQVGEVISAGGTSVPVVSGGRFRGPHVADAISTVFEPRSGVSLPVAAHQVVGEIKVYKDGALVGTLPAVAGAAVPASQPGWIESGLLALMSLAGEVHSAIGLR